MTAEIAISLLNKVMEIQKVHPDMTQRVDGLQKELYETMKSIRQELASLGPRERDIFTVSIINFIHEKAEEILLD